jgi:hypothetical protein
MVGSGPEKPGLLFGPCVNFIFASVPAISFLPYAVSLLTFCFALPGAFLFSGGSTAFF